MFDKTCFIMINYTFKLSGSCCALKCWYCIGDNCAINPDNNDKAEERLCQQGQFCQVNLYC